MNRSAIILALIATFIFNWNFTNIVHAEGAVDPVAQYTMDKIDATTATISGYLDQVMVLASKYGPDIADLSLNALRLDALRNIVPPMSLIAVAGILFFASRTVQQPRLTDRTVSIKQLLNTSYRSRTSYHDNIVAAITGSRTAEWYDLSPSDRERFEHAYIISVATSIPIRTILLLMSGVSAFLGIIATAMNVTSIVGLFYPELYAIHKFILAE